MTKKKRQINPTQSAKDAADSSPTPSTTSQNAPTAETPKPEPSPTEPTAQPQLSDQEKAQLKNLADVLGVTTLAQQVDKLTQAVNSLMGQTGKPAAQTVPAGANQFMQGLMPIIQQAIPAILGAFTNPGQGNSPYADVDKTILEDTLKAARERDIAMKDAAHMLVDQMRQGKQIFHNKETGDIVITNPAGQNKESSS